MEKINGLTCEIDFLAGLSADILKKNSQELKNLLAEISQEYRMALYDWIHSGKDSYFLKVDEFGKIKKKIKIPEYVAVEKFSNLQNKIHEIYFVVSEAEFLCRNFSGLEIDLKKRVENQWEQKKTLFSKISTGYGNTWAIRRAKLFTQMMIILSRSLVLNKSKIWF